MLIDKIRENKLKEFEEIIQLEFKNKDFINQAFIHISYANENVSLAIPNNERMEFLGDAILGMIISEYLMEIFPHYDEGKLSKIKGVIVSRETLAERAVKINLGEYLLLGKGESLTDGKAKSSILSGTFEALICAIYWEFDYLKTKQFIIAQFQEEIERIRKNKHKKDHKSILQKISLTIFNILPQYEVIDTEGPEHKKKFTVKVFLREGYEGMGIAYNKKTAEQKAAAEVLKQLEINLENF